MSIDNDKITFGNSHVKYIKDNKDNIWFKAKHVALILEYKNTNNVTNHVDEEDRITYDKLLSNGCAKNGHPPSSYKYGSQFISNEDPKTIFINESGLYSIMLRSKLPKAKQFKRWVTSEVLPAIRKTGSYEFNSNLLITRYSNKNIIYCYKLKNYLNHYKFGITSDIERRENEHHREIGNIEPTLIRETDNTKNIERDIKHVFKKKNLLVNLNINDKNQTVSTSL
ncbi:putative BRO-F [Heterosigma akashiwo virus 01]|uniref:Putative BRO-F n=1 Tax=Heterosigma akashiwo virus 01 TaxID=97195 RepID=A0A1C9C5G0_HAV01|nr:anti-repressor Ant [Heterosigma akashiwo virus 01]AOM63517.1 putative BRO-F [Heterosigma akashiwo virus 01]